MTASGSTLSISTVKSSIARAEATRRIAKASGMVRPSSERSQLIEAATAAASKGSPLSKRTPGRNLNCQAVSVTLFHSVASDGRIFPWLGSAVVSVSYMAVQVRQPRR